MNNKLYNELNLRRLLTSSGVSSVRANLFTPILVKYFIEYKFSDLNILQFLANVFVETGNLNTLVENLNYSADGLRATFSIFRNGRFNADEFARNPEKIANTVYNSNIRKADLGNFNPGDGWRYRGRGLLQTTGRFNYNSLTQSTGIDFLNNPDLLEQPEFAVKSSIIFYVNNVKLETTILRTVRIRINGSEFHFDKVLQNFNRLQLNYNKI